MGAILTCGASSCELFGMQFHTESVSPGADPFRTDGSGLDRMDFSQKYIPDEYLELRIPAGVGGDGSPVFKMDPSHLHIWPRHSFMLIALPNKVSLLRGRATATLIKTGAVPLTYCPLFALHRIVHSPLLYSRLRTFLTAWKRHRNSSVGLMASFQTHCNSSGWRIYYTTSDTTHGVL